MQKLPKNFCIFQIALGNFDTKGFHNEFVVLQKSLKDANSSLFCFYARTFLSFSLYEFYKTSSKATLAIA
jgi:hypothetical protein